MAWNPLSWFSNKFAGGSTSTAPYTNLQLNQLTTAGRKRPGPVTNIPGKSDTPPKPMSVRDLHNATTGRARIQARTPGNAPIRATGGNLVAGAVAGLVMNKWGMPAAHALGGKLGLGQGGLLRGMFSEEEQRQFDAKRLRNAGGSADLRGSATPGSNTAKSAALAKKQEAELYAAAQTQLTDLDRNDGGGNISVDDLVNTELTRRSINSTASEAAEDLGLTWGGNGRIGDGQLQEWTTDMDMDAPAVPIDSSISRGIKIGEDGLPVHDPFFAYNGPNGALGALRAKEASSNILHAAGGERNGIGGSKWVKDGDKLIPISNEDAQQILGGEKSAQEFLNGKLYEWTTDMDIGAPSVPIDSSI